LMRAALPLLGIVATLVILAALRLLSIPSI
jgi:hypothetical protein